MNISQKTLTTLEFDKIRAMLADCALTEGAILIALAEILSFLPFYKQNSSVSFFF